MKHLASLNKYFVKYRWHFVLGIVFTIASNYFGVQMPKYVKQSIDELQNANYDLETPLHLALMVGGWFILLSLGKGLFLFFMRQTIIVMSRRIEYDMKNEIFKHYQSCCCIVAKKDLFMAHRNHFCHDIKFCRS